MKLRSGIVVFYLVLAGIAFNGACNLKPGDNHSSSSSVDSKATPDTTSVNDLKPRITKDDRGNMTERHDVTLTPNGEIKFRNEYHYTYDAQNNRTSEQIWRRTPDGALVSRTHNTFLYENNLLMTNTSASFDNQDKEITWLQNKYEYDQQHREKSVTLYNKQGMPLSRTERIYNDKGILWKEITIEYENGREKHRSGLEYSEKGAVVKEF
jgi:hypothetical protein